MLSKSLHLAVMIALLVTVVPLTPAAAQSTATIGGTIRYNGAPVEGVFGFVSWQGGGAEYVTGLVPSVL